jgi:3'(2'), 5'-bisphosphate nucleotidase
MKISESLLQQVIRIAREAGDSIMEVYRGEFTIEHKHDQSPLTQADLAAHRVIESGLRALQPQLPVLSEESTVIPYSERASWDTYWLVDPLDGTREFIKRNGEFTVNIALIHQGASVLGVVYAPERDTLYYAASGLGAFKQLSASTSQPISARPLDAKSIVIAGSRSHADGRLDRFVANITNQHAAPQLLSLGSSLKICMVAEGAADVYPRLGPTSEWDTAAAQCVLELAGGHLVQKNGQRLRYNQKDSLLNTEFFACGATLHPWHVYLE